MVNRLLLAGGRVRHADLLAGRACQPADGLELGVQNRLGEVPFGVRQPAGIVGPGCPAQGQVTLALYVTQQRLPLPRWAVGEEILGCGDHHVVVFSDEQLLLFGEP